MKPITPELKSKLIQSNAGLKKVKWNEIFDTEEELVMVMFNEKVIVENASFLNLCRGFEYIKSFKEYYSKNNYLTDRQMTQLKRLASQMAYQIYCN